MNLIAEISKTEEKLPVLSKKIGAKLNGGAKRKERSSGKGERNFKDTLTHSEVKNEYQNRKPTKAQQPDSS